MSGEPRYSAGVEAWEAGGTRLVRFLDMIWQEQRKRWNAPDWRGQPITAADVQNYRDIAVALERVCEEL